MKTVILRTLLIALPLLSACKRQDDPVIPKEVPRASKTAENTASIPTDPLSSATRAEQSMEKQIDTTSLNSALQLFNVQEGRFPNNLDELVSKKYLGKLPVPPFGTKIEYHVKEGRVSLVKK